MAKFEYVEWLFMWLLETVFFEFDWDSGNLFKSLQKHKVSHEEIEAIFASEYKLPLGVQFQPAVPEDRYAIVGATASGLILTVVFTLRGGKVRPISARPANRRERRVYETLR